MHTITYMHNGREVKIHTSREIMFTADGTLSIGGVVRPEMPRSVKIEYVFAQQVSREGQMQAKAI